MLADIQFWTLEGDLNATKQYRMLVSKYQCRIIKQNLYNAIYSICFNVKRNLQKMICVFLLEKKADDLEWVVDIN